MPRITGATHEFGVDEKSNFVVVPLNGSNYVGLMDAKGFSLHFDPQKLAVHETQTARSKNNMHHQWIGHGLVNHDTENSRQQVAANLAHAGNRGNTRLLLVDGKVRGLHTIKARNGKINFEFEVSVVPRQTHYLAFKFVRHPGKDGTMKSRTKWTPADAPRMVNQLNWIYSHQANIGFDLIEADYVDVNQDLGENRLSARVFLDSIVGKKNQNADVNVFFAGKYGVNLVGNITAGSTFDDESSCIVDDTAETMPVTSGTDPFLMNLAHEIAHYLINSHGVSTAVDDHHDRPDVLLSRKIQSNKVDKGLVNLINKP